MVEASLAFWYIVIKNFIFMVPVIASDIDLPSSPFLNGLLSEWLLKYRSCMMWYSHCQRNAGSRERRTQHRSLGACECDRRFLQRLWASKARAFGYVEDLQKSLKTYTEIIIYDPMRYEIAFIFKSLRWFMTIPRASLRHLRPLVQMMLWSSGIEVRLSRRHLVTWPRFRGLLLGKKSTTVSFLTI